MSRGAADRIDMSVHASGPRPVIVIGLPSFGMVHLFFVARYYNLRMPMNRVVRHVYVVGKEVGDARNEIVAKALDIETQDPTLRCEYVFFLDDDVLCHPDVLNQLMSHDRPIVSGLYYTKTEVPTPLVLHEEFGGTARSWTPGELVECHGHGMGLTLIKADVFRHLLEHGDLGTDQHGLPAWFATTRDARILRPSGVGGLFNQTEDMRFLTKARALGFETCVDTGPTAFGWHLDTKTMKAYPLKQWEQFAQTGRITWQTETGEVTW